MSRPFLLAQISDPHLGERARDAVEPEACLREVVAPLGRLRNRPDAGLVSGDLAEYGSPIGLSSRRWRRCRQGGARR